MEEVRFSPSRSPVPCFSQEPVKPQDSPIKPLGPPYRGLTRHESLAKRGEFERDVSRRLKNLEVQLKVCHEDLSGKLDRLSKGAQVSSNQIQTSTSSAQLFEALVVEEVNSTYASEVSQTILCDNGRQITPSKPDPAVETRWVPTESGASSSGLNSAGVNGSLQGMSSVVPLIREDTKSISNGSTGSNNAAKYMRQHSKDEIRILDNPLNRTKSLTKIAPALGNEVVHVQSGRSKLSGLSRASLDTPTKSQVSDIITRHRKRSEVALVAFKFLDNPESSYAATLYHFCLPYLLGATVVFTILQTVDPSPIEETICRMVDIVVDALFAIEIVVRYIVTPNRGRAFFLNVFNIIDASSSLPLVVRIVTLLSHEDADHDMTTLFLCVVAIFRLLKMMRRFQKIHLLLGAFQVAFEALPVLIYTLIVLTLAFASVVYLLEPEGTFLSFPMAIYFTIVTMTTVGYGDITPQSTEGTSVVTVLTVTSVLYMAMPLGIVGHAFTQVWQDRDRILLVKKTQAALQQWGYTPQDIHILFSAFDSNGEGELNITDFRRMITHMNIGLSERRICELFHSFDLDGNGYVDDRELVRHIFPQAYHELYGETASEESNAAHYCSCGALVLHDALFCRKCGKQVERHLGSPRHRPDNGEASFHSVEAPKQATIAPGEDQSALSSADAKNKE